MLLNTSHWVISPVKRDFFCASAEVVKWADGDEMQSNAKHLILVEDSDDSSDSSSESEPDRLADPAGGRPDSRRTRRKAATPTMFSLPDLVSAVFTVPTGRLPRVVLGGS